MEDYYTKYRGKCKELSEAFLEENPEYELVRGYYICPMWGAQQHWWAKHTETFEIVDVTVKQFPTAGAGASYEEFDGYVACSECGKRIKEEDAQFAGRYPVCSTKCYGTLVGVYV